MYEPGKPLEEYEDSVRHLVEAIRGADALLVSTAAYHGTLAGVTKNALDYVQFLGKEEHPYFDGKVVGLVSTAGGEQAATNANAALVHVVHALRGIVAPLMVGVTKAWQRTDDAGTSRTMTTGGGWTTSAGSWWSLPRRLEPRSVRAARSPSGPWLEHQGSGDQQRRKVARPAPGCSCVVVVTAILISVAQPDVRQRRRA